jgi:predicted GNAT family N-acyltransferase
MSHLSIKVAELPADFPAIQAIRQTVFQVEQGVDAALDFDGQDESADHLVAYLGHQPVGTTRIRYLDAQTAKIERLAILPAFRRQGIGKKIMQQAIALLSTKDIQWITIHAQEYVKELYQTLGFETVGERFEEAGIPHIKMQKKLI